MSAFVRLGDVARVDRAVGPHAGEAVGLQLEIDTATLGPGDALLHAAHGAEQVLHMMAVLVRHDVGLRERSAGRAELAPQLVEEPEVEVDVAVVGTVERPDVGGCRTTAGLDLIREQPRLRRLVGLCPRLGTSRPELLHAVDDADDAAVGAWLASAPVRHCDARLLAG